MNQLKQEIMTTQNQKTVTVIKGEKTDIYNNIRWQHTNEVRYDNLIGDTLIALIINNANSELKEIAKKYEFANLNPTKEEAIAMTYEISNNQSKYLEAMGVYNDSCKDTALEVLRELYPNESDADLKKSIR